MPWIRRNNNNNPNINSGSENFTYNVPRKARGGIKAHSEHGEFARNWWAKRWLQAMERLMLDARLERARHYARQGQVLSLDETRDGITAKVQGSRPAPYRVNIAITHFSNTQWDKIMDVLASQAIFAAQLLAGEMPQNIEQAFFAAGASLFPEKPGDLKTECSCPDWANPCKHIAAVFYILGDRFDEDPFLLFRMRGHTQDEVLAGLRKRRPAGVEEEQSESSSETPPAPPSEPEQPLDSSLENFYSLRMSLQDFPVSIKPPVLPLPILERLGEPDLPVSLRENLKNAYDMVSQAVLLLAYQSMENDLQEDKSNGN